MKYLNLIRWKNLIIIALSQTLIKYALFEPSDATTTLNWFGFSLLVFATICISAAGYVINDIYDIETDLVNRPEKVIVGKSVSEKAANNLFIILNVVGVLIGFYLSHLIDKSSFFALFVVISALLYVYASYLKQTFLIGNLVVSTLVAFSLIIVGIFELLPIINPQNQAVQLYWFNILLIFALFAFMINFLREVLKDIQDVDGDHKQGMNTVPIVLGRNRAKNILFVLSFIPTLVLIYFIVNVLYLYIFVVSYFLLMVIAPMILITIKLFNAKSKKDYQIISNLLKLVMLTGVLSMILYPLLLK